MSTLAFAEDCNHPDTAFGAPGNGWTDLKGDDWQFNTQLLRCKGTSGGQYTYGCQRPAGEVTQNAGIDQASVTYGTCLSLGAGAVGSGFAANLRQSGSGATFNGYVCLVAFSGGIMRIKKVVNGVQSDLTSGAFTATAGAPYALIFEAVGTNPTVLTAKVYKTSDITTPLKVLTINDSTAAMQIAGTLGLSDPAAQFDHSRFEEWNFDGTNDPTLIAAGINLKNPYVDQTNPPTQTSINLDIALATGSFQLPITYNWYRSTDPTLIPPGQGTFLFSNTGGSQTSGGTDSGLTPGTLYFYKVYAVDSSSPTPLTAVSGACGGYTPLAATVVIGGIGDSIMANQPHDGDNDLGLGTGFATALYDPLKIAGRYLEKTVPGLRSVTVNNQAVPGLTSIDWKPAVVGLPPSSYTLVGQANSNVGVGQLLTALNAFLLTTPSPTYVMVMLGANDSRPGFRTSQADYQANMLGICNALIGNGFTPILDYPTWVQDGADQTHDPTSIQLILQYVQACDNIVNGSAGLIKQGDIRSFYWLCNNVIMFEGNGPTTSPNLGVHPNGDGVYMLGSNWGRIFSSLIDGTAVSLVVPALLASGIFFFLMKGYQVPGGFQDKLSAYMPLALADGSEMNGGGLLPPYSLGWISNKSAQPITVTDGAGGKTLKRLLPGQVSFLEPGNLTLGKNTPAVSGGGSVEYCLWSSA